MSGAVGPPLALLAELTHRCPLRCPYCSNPLELERAGAELDEATWRRVLSEAAALGVLQVHFSGGEPLVRRDLAALVRHATAAGLYSNLITSGVLLDRARLRELVEAGLEHVQLSFQDALPPSADRFAGLADAHERKLAAAALVRDAGLPLTVNAVMHRQNLERLPQMIDLALALGARRLEVAHVQYYGWALANRTALLPTAEQLEQATETVERARRRWHGVLTIDYVVPDYYARRPKACMGGWGRQFLNLSPAGKVLPCHAAESLPGFDFPSVKSASLAEIWYRSEAFNRFRGTDWMPEPCRSCERREIDWGGCRCQAFQLTGDAARTDPACALAPDRALLEAAREAAAAAPAGEFRYRQFGTAPGAGTA
ncbi:MAG TPA: pyrroloquinoline quinone biosynthesis protein PqqE [Stellaceae bacterium]|jgi:pyrroloquinoline quinone biosynthesis protein E|nr:pyrroloquinoline quinone biosynthesis protein PqqE [Stellaceae bacterium]